MFLLYNLSQLVYNQTQYELILYITCIATGSVTAI